MSRGIAIAATHACSGYKSSADAAGGAWNCGTCAAGAGARASAVGMPQYRLGLAASSATWAIGERQLTQITIAIPTRQRITPETCEVRASSGRAARISAYMQLYLRGGGRGLVRTLPNNIYRGEAADSSVPPPHMSDAYRRGGRGLVRTPLLPLHPERTRRGHGGEEEGEGGLEGGRRKGRKGRKDSKEQRKQKERKSMERERKRSRLFRGGRRR